VLVLACYIVLFCSAKIMGMGDGPINDVQTGEGETGMVL
jgi:hypothetical protein